MLPLARKEGDERAELEFNRVGVKSRLILVKVALVIDSRCGKYRRYAQNQLYEVNFKRIPDY